MRRWRAWQWWWSLPRRTVSRISRVMVFVGYFSVRLVVANLVVAREIVTPGSGLSPGIVEFPLHTRTGTELVMMALVVGLTPGTLTVEVRSQPPAIFVHGMHAADPDTFRRALRAMEERLLAALRPVGGPAGRGEP